MSGIYLHELRLSGLEKHDASVVFDRGANIISGPSNTGKTFIFECIEYMLGKSSIDRRIKESRGYQNIFLEIRTYSGNKFTIKSDLEGGDFYKFECSIDDIAKETNYSTLKREHSPNKKNTLSYFILEECNLSNLLVRTNASGKKRELSLRDLRILHLVDELRVPTKNSPFLTGQHISSTVEENVLKLLLTATDDSHILESIPEKILANKVGRLEVLNELIGIEKSNIQNSPSYADILEQKEKLIKSISENQAKQNVLLSRYKDLDDRKKEVSSEIYEITIRYKELSKLHENTFVLEKQYFSDIKRLRSTIEVGETLANLEEVNCPVCDSLIENNMNTSVANISESARSELLKLEGLMSELEKAKSLFEVEIQQLNEAEQLNSSELDDINVVIGEDIKIKHDNLSKLVDSQQTKLREISLLLKDYEKLQYLEKQKKEVDEIIEDAPPKKRPFEKVSSSLMTKIALNMEKLLKQWGYPDVGRVTYSEDNKDFVISGENRNLTGKGYRAITFSSFILSLLKTSANNDKKFGFCLIDSPLVTYKKPDVPDGEGILEDMANEFYRSLINTDPNSQVIIIENEDVPKDVDSNVRHIHFTKHLNIGRYGFIPQK